MYDLGTLPRPILDHTHVKLTQSVRRDTKYTCIRNVSATVDMRWAREWTTDDSGATIMCVRMAGS
jgi:hypothetical protein